jgi:hypothetical protein
MARAGYQEGQTNQLQIRVEFQTSLVFVQNCGRPGQSTHTGKVGLVGLEDICLRYDFHVTCEHLYTVSTLDEEGLCCHL